MAFLLSVKLELMCRIFNQSFLVVKGNQKSIPNWSTLFASGFLIDFLKMSTPY